MKRNSPHLATIVNLSAWMILATGSSLDSLLQLYLDFGTGLVSIIIASNCSCKKCVLVPRESRFRKEG
jgi:hypothetical protein